MVLIADLPEECILRILFWLPETDLFSTVPLVCKQWQRIASTAIESRDRLTILVGEDPVLLLKSLSKFYISHSNNFANDLSAPFAVNGNIVRGYTVSELNEDIVQRIIKTFPNLERLSIVNESVSCEQFKHILTLVRYYAVNLIALELYCVYLEDSNEFKVVFNVGMKTLFLNLNTIERFPKLKHLILYFDDCPLLNDHPVLDWFLLKRLSTLYFHCRHCREVLFPLMFQNDETSVLSQLREVGLNGKMPTRELLERYLQLPAELSSKFTHIFDNYSSLDKSVLPQFFAHFPNLVSLSLDILTNWSLESLTNCLSALKNLISLKLIIGCPSDSFAGGNNAATAVGPSIKTSTVSPLSSVKILKICMDFESHHDIDRLRLAAIFPAVHYIDIVADRPFKCQECSALKAKPKENDKVQQQTTEGENNSEAKNEEVNAERGEGVGDGSNKDDSCLALLLEPIEKMQNTTPLLQMTYRNLWPAY